MINGTLQLDIADLSEENSPLTGGPKPPLKRQWCWKRVDVFTTSCQLMCAGYLPKPGDITFRKPCYCGWKVTLFGKKYIWDTGTWFCWRIMIEMYIRNKETPDSSGVKIIVCPVFHKNIYVYIVCIVMFIVRRIRHRPLRILTGHMAL